MANVVGLTCVGSAYQRGMRMPGWGLIKLDDGTEIYVGESENYFDAMCARAEAHGHSVVEMREKLDRWVQTGQFAREVE